MPGGLPGPVGLVVFTGVKFGGYFLAGTVLRKYVPAIHSSALKIAVGRTVLGLILGPPVTITWMWMVGLPAWSGSWLDSGYVFYAGLGVVRVFVWALVLLVVSEHKQSPASRFWLHAFLCALWSCLLDVPGYALALIAPGRISIC
jgi:hypothetical protein